MTEGKEWGDLSIDEKLTELGFQNEGGKLQADFRLTTEQSERLHAALDQLLDTGGLMIEIEAMVEPAATGVIGAQPDIICREVYELIQAEEEEEDDDE